MRRLLLLVMVFPLLMVSCSRGGKELAAKLHLADSLIEAEPDSGVALLMSLEEEAADASRANRYRYQLLLAKAMNKTYRPITTDSVIPKPCCSMRRPSPRPTPPARTATSRRWAGFMGRRLASYGSSISP